MQGRMRWLDMIEVLETGRMALDMCKNEIAIAQKHALASEKRLQQHQALT